MNPYNRLTKHWQEVLKRAEEVKETKFSKTAREICRYYDADFNWFWTRSQQFRSGEGDQGHLSQLKEARPVFRVTDNLISDVVRLFTPALAQENPNVSVNPRLHEMPDPVSLGLNMDDAESAMFYQQFRVEFEADRMQRSTRADIQQSYLNWLQKEANKLDNAERMITDALTAGMGFMQTDLHQPFGSNISYPLSSYVSWEDVLFDPDAKYERDIYWMARRHVQPVNVVEDRFGLPRGYLRGTWSTAGLQSAKNNSANLTLSEKMKLESHTHDLIEWWEIWSVNGIGQHLKHIDSLLADPYTREQIDAYEACGRNAYLCISKGVEFPLNLPPWVTGDIDAAAIEMIRARTQWPSPLQALDESWPLNRLAFYHKPGEVYPIALAKPAVPLMEVVNWAMSFLVQQAAQGAKSYTFIAATAAKQIREQLAEDKGPLPIVELNEVLQHRNLSEIIHRLDGPEMPVALWTVIKELHSMVEKRVGLNELMYGMSSRQMRSAKEADLYEAQMMIRPREMARKVRICLSRIAKTEMQTARAQLTVDDVAGALGPFQAAVWEQSVMTTDYQAVVRDFEYDVQAGSFSEMTTQQKGVNLEKFQQYFGQAAIVAMQSGDSSAVNGIIEEFGRINQIDVSKWLLPNLAPPAPPQQQPVA